MTITHTDMKTNKSSFNLKKKKEKQKKNKKKKQKQKLFYVLSRVWRNIIQIKALQEYPSLMLMKIGFVSTEFILLQVVEE